jgi:hypothetical protein
MWWWWCVAIVVFTAALGISYVSGQRAAADDMVEILVEATKKFDAPTAAINNVVQTVVEETYARPTGRLPLGALHLRI